MTKFLSDLLVKGILTADNGLTLGSGKNISTTNQAYIGATNYVNSVVVGWDVGAVYLGYSMGALPIHIGTQGTGDLRIRTSGNTIVENGNLLVGTLTGGNFKADINGVTRLNGKVNIGNLANVPGSVVDILGANTTAGQNGDLRIRHSATDGNTMLMTFGVSNVGGGGYNQGHAYIQTSYWGGNIDNPLFINPKGTVGIVINHDSYSNNTISFGNAVVAQGSMLIKPSSNTNGGVIRGYGFAASAYNAGSGAFSSGMYGQFAQSSWQNGIDLVFITISGNDVTTTEGIDRLRIKNTGELVVSSLAGTGTRMVVADSNGQLSVQTVPTLSLTDTLDSVTDRGAVTTNSITTGGATINGNLVINNGDITGEAPNGASFGFYPSGGYYELATAPGTNQGPILIFNCKYTGKQVGFYAGDTTYPGMLLYEQAPVGGDIAYWSLDKWAMTPNQNLVWAATSGGIAIAVGPYDLGLSREAAGLLQVNTGTDNAYASLKALNLTATDSVYAKTKFSLENEIAELGIYDSGSGGANINSYLSLFSNNNDAYGDGIALRYSRGSKASPLDVQAGDIAGGFYFKPYSGGVYASQSFIECLVTGDELFAKTEMQFATSNGFNQGGFVWMTLKEDGELHLASPTTWVDKGAYRLQVDGAIYASGAKLADLAGTGSRMVVADSAGTLSTQAMPSGSLQGALDADKATSGSLAIGTTTVKSVSASTYSGAFFDYVVKKGTHVRVGSVVVITNGSDIENYETLSNDIGTTTDLTFTATLSGGNINLNAVAASTGWTVIVSTRAI